MWNLTPAQMAAEAESIQAQLDRDKADALEIAALGARGEGRAIDKQLRKWRS